MNAPWWHPLLEPAPGRTRQITSWNDDVRGGDFFGTRPAAARPKRILLEPGEVHSVASIDGPGVITRIWTTVMPFQPHSGLREVVLRFYWDGEVQPSVECSLGDFFGAPFGRARSYQSAVLSRTGGGFVSSFPMPFATGARLELANEGRSLVDPLFYQVTFYQLDEAPPTDLRLHAQWSRENPVRPGEPFQILDASGQGHFVGTRLDMQNLDRWLGRRPMESIFPYGLGFGMLEGPEHIYVDGEQTPSVSGTGTEDYFNAGWYFQSKFSAPTHGCTVRSWPTGRASAYRFHVDDPIPFHKSIRVVMDHGIDNQIAADYSSVAYWYQAEPHRPYPQLPSPESRRPTSAAGNVAQSLAVLVPVTGVGLVAMRNLLRRHGR